MRLNGLYITAVLMLAACSGNYKYPSASSNPQAMSADTLCYRYAYAKRNQELADEVAARNLNCEDLLSDDPLSANEYSYGNGR